MAELRHQKRWTGWATRLFIYARRRTTSGRARERLPHDRTIGDGNTVNKDVLGLHLALHLHALRRSAIHRQATYREHAPGREIEAQRYYEQAILLFSIDFGTASTRRRCA